MKIFYQFGKYKELKPTRGDFITELSIIKAIKKFAEVSCDESKNDYDLYYVRNNPELFLKLPHPKIYFAIPYNEEAYNDADAIVTFTDEMTQKMRDGIPVYGIGDKVNGILSYGLSPNRNVVTIHQVVNDTFKPLQNHPRTKEIRDDIGGDFIIGYFGSIRESNYPYSFLHILPKLKEKYPGLKVVFGGCELKEYNEHVLMKSYDYPDMPYVISACDLLLNNCRYHAGGISGCMKVLEGMACGVPTLNPKLESRVRELGKNYELYYPFMKPIENGGFPEKVERIMFNKICKIIDNKKLRNKISKRLIRRSKLFRIEIVAKEIKKIFEELI